MLEWLLAADLPKPPVLERWVLEQPWPLALALSASGALVWYSMNQRGRGRRGLIFGALFVAVGIGVLLAGMLIETPRERVAGLTDRLLEAVFASDDSWAEAHISDRLVVASAGEIYEGFGKAELVQAVRGFRAIETRQWSKRLRGAAQDGEGVVRTQVTIKVQARITGMAEVPGTWEFIWRRGSDDRWLLTRLECLTIWGRPPTYNWEREARGIGRGGSSGGEGALQRERI